MAFKEQVTFYSDESKTRPVFGFKARARLDLNSGYDITDETGQQIGFFRKDFGASLLRSTFHIEGPGYTGTGQERSQLVALVRRFTDIPFLPIHFDYVDSAGAPLLRVERQGIGARQVHRPRPRPAGGLPGRRGRRGRPMDARDVAVSAGDPAIRERRPGPPGLRPRRPRPQGPPARVADRARLRGGRPRSRSSTTPSTTTPASACARRRGSPQTARRAGSRSASSSAARGTASRCRRTRSTASGARWCGRRRPPDWRASTMTPTWSRSAAGCTRSTT